jgi:hypothetical protein
MSTISENGGSKGYHLEEEEHEEKLDIFQKQLDFIYDDLMEWPQYKTKDGSEVTQMIERNWKFKQQRRIASAFDGFRQKLYEIVSEQKDHGRRWYLRYDENSGQYYDRCFAQ